MIPREQNTPQSGECKVQIDWDNINAVVQRVTGEVCRRSGICAFDQDDIAQQILVAAWSGGLLDRYNPGRASLEAYLSGAAIHMCCSRNRAMRRRSRLLREAREGGLLRRAANFSDDVTDL
jgi:DNA-directed RNA polymerase specialized sigma24 family protein